MEEFKRKQRSSFGLSEQQQQRRHSELMAFRSGTSSSAPPAPPLDLISFSGPDLNPTELDSAQQPNAGTSVIPDKHTSFVQFVDQIHQMTAQQHQYLATTASTPYGRSPLGIPIAGPAGMQLMPYQAKPPATAAAPQTQPLTPDNLQKLYNSPYYAAGGVSAAGTHPRYPGPSHHQQQQHHFMATAAFPGHLQQPLMNQQVVRGVGAAPLSGK